MFSPTNWKDRVVQFPRRFRDQNNNVLTLTPDPGTVTEEGTPFSAANMNRLEHAVYMAPRIVDPSTGKHYVWAIEGGLLGIREVNE